MVDRLSLLTLDEMTGVLGIDPRFRDSDGKTGFSFSTRTWPHGRAGKGAPHGAVFSR